ncbi:MAG: AbrB/MazE/SpoVT family DNA-binding domain-containing protein [Dehalococcoidia bacterium]|nr:AbrB/MazE/SpoVT family DNA-binding domain-containing protein [Dehalococcoidia bacterium]
MSTSHTISMDEGGALRIPDELRRRLGLSGPAELEAEFDPETGTLVLRPAGEDGDSWAYAPEHLEQLARGTSRRPAGRLRSLDPADFEALDE